MSSIPTESNPNMDILDIYQFRENYTKPDDSTTLNFVSGSRIPSNIFKAFPNTGRFTMFPNVTDLYSEDFIGAINLIELRLEKNKIKVIRADVFTTGKSVVENGETVFPLHKLIELHLQQNEISTIEDNSFYDLINLKIIDLSQNQLKVINRLTLAGLPALEELNLRKNQIESIADGALNFPHLDTLNLSRNKLKRLSDDIFQQLPVVGWIYLSNNELEHIGQSLYKLPEVKRIRLNHNCIEDLDLAAFAKMSKLNVLSVQSNGFMFGTTEIGYENAWNSTLTYLEIDYNKLSYVNDLRKLRIFPHLETLALNGNWFSDLEIKGYGTLKDILPSLRSLYIRNLVSIDCSRMASFVRKLEAQSVEVTHDC